MKRLSSSESEERIELPRDNLLEGLPNYNGFSND
jgi:hypothetical protein